MKKSTYHLISGDVVRSFNGGGDKVITTELPYDRPKKIVIKLLNNKTGVERTVVWGRYTTVAMQPEQGWQPFAHLLKYLLTVVNSQGRKRWTIWTRSKLVTNLAGIKSNSGWIQSNTGLAALQSLVTMRPPHTLTISRKLGKWLIIICWQAAEIWIQYANENSFKHFSNIHSNRFRFIDGVLYLKLLTRKTKWELEQTLSRLE